MQEPLRKYLLGLTDTLGGGQMGEARTSSCSKSMLSPFRGPPCPVISRPALLSTANKTTRALPKWKPIPSVDEIGDRIHSEFSHPNQKLGIKELKPYKDSA